MPRSAYPTVADMSAFLASANVSVTDTGVLAASLAAGIAAFEREAGRVMLATGPATRAFDPAVDRDGTLDLNADLARVDTVTYQPVGTSATALAAGTDYVTKPDNALARGWPITELVILPRWWAPLAFTQRGALQVTGLWGYGLQIPDDAWLAMLYAGLAQAGGSPMVHGLPVHPATTQWTANSGDEDRFSFGAWLAGQLASWQATYCAAVRRYARYSV